MFQGNWKCSGCGGAITSLPFEPRNESGLTCRDCYFKDKNGGAAGTGSSDADAATPADAVSGAPDEQEVPDDLEFGIAGEQTDAPDFTADMTAPADKPKHTGDWKCSGCGAAITSLPFEPRSTENLKCIDCFKKSKNT